MFGIFGLVNIQGLKKPSYHGYWFLSRLGEEVVAEGDGYAVTRFDRQHGSVFDAWVAMGTPQHILPADLEVLRRRMELDVAVERISTPEGSLEWSTTVQPFGVTLVEIGHAAAKSS